MPDRALVAAPTGRDAALLGELLGLDGVVAEAFPTVTALCEGIADDVVAVLIAEEALDAGARRRLQQVLGAQPPWSDLPIVLLVRAGEHSTATVWALGHLGNVSIVERPTRRSAVLASIRVALRSRRRQYELREHLASLRRLAHQLHESQQELHAAFDQAPQGAALCGLDGDLVRVNASFARMFGRSPDDLIGVRFPALLTPAERPRCAEAWRHVLAGPSEDLEVETSNGRALHVWLSRLDDEAGRARRVALLALDVTDRKRAELERQRLQEELVSAQRLETVGRLAGGIAHEFNNMLAIIINYASIAAARPAADESIRGDLEEVLTASRRCADLTRAMMMYGRRDMAQPERVQVNAVVARVTRLLHSSFGGGVHLALDLDPGVPDVQMPTVHLDQLVSHLVRNALEALDGQGRLRVATRGSDGSAVHVVVEDDGPGMPEHVREVAAEPFFTTKEVGGGPGLGLSIVHGVVTSAGGRVRIDSAPGRGTRVDVELPAAAPAAEVVPRRPSRPARGASRVLVVDDEPSLVALMAELLAEAGFDVVRAESGEAALDRVRQQGVDVVVTDVLMPGMSGPQLARELRQRFPRVGVVFVSGYPAEHHRITLAGADWTFLQKPFDQQALVAAIRDVTDHGWEERAPGP